MGSRLAMVMPINQAFEEALKDQLWRSYLAGLDAEEEGGSQ